MAQDFKETYLSNHLTIIKDIKNIMEDEIASRKTPKFRLENQAIAKIKTMLHRKKGTATYGPYNLGAI